MSNSEEMMRAALLTDRASDDITRQANRIEESALTLQRLFDPGYADNAAHLIRLLESAAEAAALQPQQTTVSAPPLSFGATLPFVHFGRNAKERVAKAPNMLQLLGLVCYPYYQAAQRGLVMGRAKFSLRLECDGEVVEIIEQERNFHPQILAGMDLLHYHVSQCCMSDGFDSVEQAIEQLNASNTPLPATADQHKLRYTLDIIPLS